MTTQTQQPDQKSTDQQRANRSRRRLYDSLIAMTEAVNNLPDDVVFEDGLTSRVVHIAGESFVKHFAGPARDACHVSEEGVVIADCPFRGVICRAIILPEEQTPEILAALGLPSEPIAAEAAIDA